MRNLILTIGFLVSCASSLTKEEVRSHLLAWKAKPDFPYTAHIRLKSVSGNRTSLDSGEVKYSPPGRTRYTLHGSKLDVVSSGDTSWSRMLDGSVKKSVRSDGASPTAMGSPATGGGPLGSRGADQDFTWKASAQPGLIEVAYQTEGPGGKVSVTETIDTGTWSVSTVRIESRSGTLDITYRYKLVDGFRFIELAKTFLGGGRYTEMELSNIRKVGSIPASNFELER